MIDAAGGFGDCPRDGSKRFKLVELDLAAVLFNPYESCHLER